MDSSLPEVLKRDIAVDGRKTISVGSVPPDFEEDWVVDASHCPVLPGFVNAHCHLSMALLRNYADDLDLFTWLHKEIWPIEAKFSREHVYISSLLGAAELIRAGVTSFADMYFFS